LSLGVLVLVLRLSMCLARRRIKCRRACESETATNGSRARSGQTRTGVHATFALLSCGNAASCLLSSPCASVVAALRLLSCCFSALRSAKRASEPAGGKVIWPQDLSVGGLALYRRQGHVAAWRRRRHECLGLACAYASQAHAQCLDSILAKRRPKMVTPGARLVPCRVGNRKGMSGSRLCVKSLDGQRRTHAHVDWRRDREREVERLREERGPVKPDPKVSRSTGMRHIARRGHVSCPRLQHTCFCRTPLMRTCVSLGYVWGSRRCVAASGSQAWL